MGLDTKKRDKLKRLFAVWPMHTIATASWLRRLGFTYDNLAGYQKHGWITRIGAGAFKRPEDNISWTGAVYGVENRYPAPRRLHVGGRTSLELQGAAHFLPLDKSKVFLFSSEKKKLPLWFSKCLKDMGVPFEHLNYNFFSSRLGLMPHSCGDFLIEISTRERASLEVVELLGRFHTFEECRLLFENLSTLRPRLVQELLENCNSIKAKRVFLFLSKNLGHKWVVDLDLTRIYLGSGPRDVTPGGVYDPEFQITYPKGFFDDDKLEV